MFRAHVEPHWFAGNTRFWYVNELAAGGREFVVVDAEQGKRTAAFDHARLAEALAKLVGKTLDATKLPLGQVEFVEPDGPLVFDAFGKGWQCDLKDYKLADACAPRSRSQRRASSTAPFAERDAARRRKIARWPAGSRS